MRLAEQLTAMMEKRMEEEETEEEVQPELWNNHQSRLANIYMN